MNSNVIFRVAIVDDDASWAASVCLKLQQEAPPGWQVVDVRPFEHLDDYISWVEANRIAAVLVDLQLNDKMPSIQYNGRDLVIWLRDKMPRLPRYYLTAHKDDHRILDSLGEVDADFDKVRFVRNDKQSFARVLRSAKNYQVDHYERLGRIAELARKAALGTATSSEIQEAEALSSMRNVAAVPVMQTKAKILSDAEALLAHADELLRKIAAKEGR